MCRLLCANNSRFAYAFTTLHGCRPNSLPHFYAYTTTCFFSDSSEGSLLSNLSFLRGFFLDPSLMRTQSVVGLIGLHVTEHVRVPLEDQPKDSILYFSFSPLKVYSK